MFLWKPHTETGTHAWLARRSSHCATSPSVIYLKGWVIYPQWWIQGEVKGSVADPEGGHGVSGGSRGRSRGQRCHQGRGQRIKVTIYPGGGGTPIHGSRPTGDVQLDRVPFWVSSFSTRFGMSFCFLRPCSAEFHHYFQVLQQIALTFHRTKY